jgi:two-component system, LytTR family, sensor kinase
MIGLFKRVPATFPLKTMVKVAWFFTSSFTLIIFLTSWLEQGNLRSTFITKSVEFILIICFNFLSILVILKLYVRDTKGARLALYAFGLIAFLGSFLVALDDLLISYLIDHHIILQGNKPRLSDVRFLISDAILNSILLTCVMVTWQLYVLAQNEKIEINLEIAALRAANSEAKNQLLLQQIHPHFLFNALSTVKSLIHKKPDEASDYVVKLSNFLRASMLSVHSGSTSLGNEIEFCSGYLELQKVRLGDALFYKVKVDQDLKLKTYLPAFALQALAENAIKHNSLSELEPLHIEISEAGGFLTVKNDYRPHNDKGHSLGSGLLNLSERYETLTGEKLLITHDEAFFYVRLKLLRK